MGRPMIEKAIDRFFKQDLNSAKMMFEMVLLEDPSNITAKLGVVCIDALQDGFIEALEIFKLALFATEEEKKKVYASFVEETSEEGNIDVEWYIDNESLAQAYIETGEKSAENHYLLGKIYEKLGDIEQAINHYEQSLFLNPLQNGVSRKILALAQKKNERKRDS